ncbi:Putative ribosomal RNA methyltransferase F45G2.9 [Toxocara canis]|uniref:rRNA methyltransferase 2, mitochondrial n=1 Tax=Toxocara canis TaxID=6265 RepID=A0A0B2W180_TOXCA|nr:Putative ribosomal RNA methyltransferase F45G2.9 [Toxocara canis]
MKPAGSVVVDVGSAPGSWCQVAAELVNKEEYEEAYVLGIDLQPMVSIANVDLIPLADITSPQTHDQIRQFLNGRSVDTVLSDMAPNPSGSVVVDVGSAPGSWCQVAAELVNKEEYEEAYVLGIDLQPMVSIANVDLIPLADITSPQTHDQIRQFLNGRSVDTVLSDMAPNPSGDGKVDHERIVTLCEHLLNLCCGDAPVIPLKKGGTFLCKIWDGQRKAELIELLKSHFYFVHNVKPEASRDHSAELYLLARKRK